jgi:hypothetical protein
MIMIREPWLALCISELIQFKMDDEADSLPNIFEAISWNNIYAPEFPSRSYEGVPFISKYI